jgi:hypothetical protein
MILISPTIHKTDLMPRIPPMVSIDLSYICRRQHVLPAGIQHALQRACTLSRRARILFSYQKVLLTWAASRPNFEC